MPSARRKRLTTARILEAAAPIVDRDGPAALTMRALARRLDVAAMALYNHYSDRDAILDALAERVFCDLAAASRSGSKGGRLTPKSRLKRILLGAQRFASEHSHLYRLAMTRPNKPASAFQLTAEAMQTLREAGLSPRRALTAYHAFVILLQGFPLWQEGYDRHTEAICEMASGGKAQNQPTASQQFAAAVTMLVDALVP